MNQDYEKEKNCMILFRMLSHDLRNLVSDVLVSSGYYLEEETELTEEMKHSMIENIHESATSLLTEMENMASVCKASSITFQRKEAVFQEVLQLALRRIRSEQKEFKFQVSEKDQDVLILADSRMLEQAIILLLRSICEHAGKCGKIACTFLEDGKYGVLMIYADAGIHQDTMNQMLSEKEYQISKMVIQAHEGSLVAHCIEISFYYEVRIPLKEWK